MAYLYQEVMKVPGLSGTWQQRNKQLYEKLGSPMGRYTGSYNQNVWLLNQIKKNDYFKDSQTAQTTTKTPTKSAGAIAGETGAEGAATTSFGEILPFEQYFDPNLVKSGIMARTSQYYDPLIEQSRQGIESEFAGRGLSRSGARNSDILSSYRDYLDQERSMQEQLLSQKQKEAKEGYALERSYYEENPTGYKPSTTAYKGYDVETPTESHYQYAKSYRDWMKGKYNF